MGAIFLHCSKVQQSTLKLKSNLCILCSSTWSFSRPRDTLGGHCRRNRCSQNIACSPASPPELLRSACLEPQVALDSSLKLHLSLVNAEAHLPTPPTSRHMGGCGRTRCFEAFLGDPITQWIPSPRPLFVGGVPLVELDSIESNWMKLVDQFFDQRVRSIGPV